MFDLGVLAGSLSPSGGGLFQCMHMSANLIAQRGFRVSVYGLLDDRFEESRAAWAVDKLTAFPIAGPQRLGYSPEMVRALSVADHDLLHLHGLWRFPSNVAKQWRRRTRRPTIISTAGMLDEWSLKRSWTKKQIIRWFYEDKNLQEATVLHANSHAEALAIRKFGLVNPIAVIPNGVELPELDNELPPRCDGRKTLLFLGRIHPKKGLQELVQAWALVRGRYPALYEDWKLAIAGWDDGGHLAQIESLAAKLELGSHISFLGPVFGDEKASLLRHAHAFVLPSHGEGMPIAVLEACSFALPAFITAECNLTECFDADAAIEISTRPAEIAETFVSRLMDQAFLRRVGANSRSLVETRYRLSSVVDRMIEVYEWALGASRRPSFVLV
jgi:glycosyltransferase involved in cell wall biosynthesis